MHTKTDDSSSHRDWPVLWAAQDFDCDGRNPTTDEPCLLGYHQGYHRDEVGVEWLDR